MPRPADRVSIYEGEGSSNKFARDNIIKHFGAVHSGGMMSSGVKGQAKMDMALFHAAKLLEAIEKYDQKEGFSPDTNTGYHAQQMARGLEEALISYGTPGNRGHQDIETFKLDCAAAIDPNIKGISREPDGMGFLDWIKDKLNALFKDDPYKFEATEISKEEEFKTAMKGLETNMFHAIKLIASFKQPKKMMDLGPNSGGQARSPMVLAKISICQNE